MSNCFSCGSDVAMFIPPLKDGNTYCVECVIAMANKQVDHMTFEINDLRPKCPYCNNPCDLSSMIGYFKCITASCQHYNERVTNNIELYRKIQS